MLVLVYTSVAAACSLKFSSLRGALSVTAGLMPLRPVVIQSLPTGLSLPTLPLYFEALGGELRQEWNWVHQAQCVYRLSAW